MEVRKVAIVVPANVKMLTVTRCSLFTQIAGTRTFLQALLESAVSHMVLQRRCR